MGWLCGPPAAICALRRSHFHDHTTNIDDIAFPRRLKLYVVVTFGLLLLYNPYAGLRRDARWLEVAIDSVEELGIGLFLLASVLWLLGRIGRRMPFTANGSRGFEPRDHRSRSRRCGDRSGRFQDRFSPAPRIARRVGLLPVGSARRETGGSRAQRRTTLIGLSAAQIMPIFALRARRRTTLMTSGGTFSRGRASLPKDFRPTADCALGSSLFRLGDSTRRSNAPENGSGRESKRPLRASLSPADRKRFTKRDADCAADA